MKKVTEQAHDTNVYFAKPRSEVTKAALETELGMVRGWPAALRTEPETVLQHHGQSLEQLVSLGDEALRERSQAESARATHRQREITALVEDVNSTRLTLYRKLLEIAQTNKLDPTWANRFFKRSPRSQNNNKPKEPTT